MFCPFCEIPMTFLGGGYSEEDNSQIEDFFCPLCGYENSEVSPLI
jgi:hypothetical protein